MPPLEPGAPFPQLIAGLVLAIEAVGSLLLCGFIARSCAQAVRYRRAPERAQRTAAGGAIFALDFKLAATVLKTLTLNEWRQIGAFVAILAIRTIVKRQMAWR